MPIFDMKYRLRHPSYQGLSGTHQTLASAHFFCFQMVSSDHQLITTDWQGHFMSFFTENCSRKKDYIRWYEKVPILLKAFNALEALPLLCASGIAQGALDYVKPYSKEVRDHQLSKTISSDRLQGLLQSKKKRRWYDQDPSLHQIVNQIYLMTQEQQAEIGLRLVFSIQSSLPTILKTTPGLSEASKRAYQEMIAGIVEEVISLPLVSLQLEANQALQEVSRLQEEMNLPLFEQVFEISRSLQIRESRIRE